MLQFSACIDGAMVWRGTEPEATAPAKERTGGCHASLKVVIYSANSPQRGAKSKLHTRLSNPMLRYPRDFRMVEIGAAPARTVQLLNGV
jgi:hypothetical protein